MSPEWQIDEVDKFMSLRRFLSKKGKREEFKAHIGKARLAMLRRKWWSTLLKTTPKLIVFGSNVKVVLLNGSDT